MAHEERTADRSPLTRWFGGKQGRGQSPVPPAEPPVAERPWLWEASHVVDLLVTLEAQHGRATMARAANVVLAGHANWVVVAAPMLTGDRLGPWTMLSPDGTASDVTWQPGPITQPLATAAAPHTVLLHGPGGAPAGGLETLRPVVGRESRGEPIVCVPIDLPSGDRLAVVYAPTDTRDLWPDALAVESLLGRIAAVQHQSAQASAQREEFMVLFHEAPTPLWVSDQETDCILVANQAAADLYGYALAEMAGLSVEVIEVVDQAGAVLDAGNTDGVPVLTRKHRRKDGEIFCVVGEWRAISFAGRPAQIFSVTVAEDPEKTARVLARERRNSELAESAARVASQLHEIATPLSSVDLHVQHLESLLARLDAVDAETQKSLSVIRIELGKAITGVRGIMASARDVDAPRAPFSVNTILTQVYDAELRSMKLDNVEPVWLLGDGIPLVYGAERLLEQACRNIVVNAVYAMKTGWRGTRRLTVRTRTHGRMVAIEFTDTGPGIPTDKFATIFDKFVTTKGQEGTGLGLSQVKSAVEADNGTVVAENLREGGARFTIMLPAYAPTADEQVPYDAAQVFGAADTWTAGHEIRVLLVDDDSAFREGLATALRSAGGFAVEVVTTGHEAIERMVSQGPEVAVLDLRMPGVNGATTWEMITKVDPTWASRIVFVTGDLLSGDTKAFMRGTGLDVLSKPVDVPQLIARLRQMAGYQPVLDV